MEQPPLKKTCTSCGQQKPLAAFLQLGGPEGTTYGPLCGDCRKAGIDKKEAVPEKDDSTTVRTGGRIDSKARIHAELDKKAQFNRTEEEYQEDRHKHQLQNQHKQHKTKAVAANERKHRESYLKKGAFLDNTVISDKQKAAENKERIEINQKKEAVKADEKLKTIDLTAPYQPPQAGGEIKQQGLAFKQFKAWLGGSAAINSPLNAPREAQENKNKNVEAQKKSLLTTIEKSWKAGKQATPQPSEAPEISKKPKPSR